MDWEAIRSRTKRKSEEFFEAAHGGQQRPSQQRPVPAAVQRELSAEPSGPPGPEEKPKDAAATVAKLAGPPGPEVFAAAQPIPGVLAVPETIGLEVDPVWRTIPERIPIANVAHENTAETKARENHSTTHRSYRSGKY